MVQVDIVWSYAFGATFAACASRQLAKEDKTFDNKWYVFILTFLAAFFAPSGLYLLWEHTQWETMQVAKTMKDIPAWLVTVFAVTNVTQGILGYWITFKLIKKKNYYGAHVNWMVSWIIFWFILVCGWDCTGYQRFLYDMSVFNGELWAPGKMMGISFFYASRVWWTLVVMAVFFAPMLIWGIIKFIKDGAKMDPSISKDQVPGVIKIFIFTFGTQWVVCLGLAIIAALTVMAVSNLAGNMLMGYIIGILIFSIAAYFLLFKRGMPMYLIAKQLFIKEPGK
ncbi:MAG: hypothetical protein ABSC11_09880 [Smithella sp.]|jgi:hypothetical protein